MWLHFSFGIQHYNRTCRHGSERIEVKQIFKKAKQQLWEDFGHKTGQNYGENKKIFYNILKQLQENKRKKNERKRPNCATY